MGKFVNDILQEDKTDNKYSSKKTMGIVAGILVCIAFIGDGSIGSLLMKIYLILCWYFQELC